MKKMTNLIKNDSNTKFEASVDIKLSNGVLVNGTIKVEEFNESFAKEKSIRDLSDVTIDSFDIKSIDIIKEGKEEKPNNDYYIPCTSWLTENSYDTALIKKTIKESSTSCSNIKCVSQFGWENQPDVVTFTIKKTNDHSEDTLVKERLENKLKYVLGTQWVRVSKKDW